MKPIASIAFIALLLLIMLFASIDAQNVCAEQVTAKPELAVTAPSIQSQGDQTRLIWYLNIVHDKIVQLWVAPPDFIASRGYYSVLKFNLDRSGHINDVTIEEGSGDASFDEAGKLAAHAVGVLPPLPSLVTEESLEIKLSFYTIRGIDNVFAAGRKLSAKLALFLHTSEPNTVVVQVDDGKANRALLRAGEWMTWKAEKRFVLSIADAGSIHGELNGKPLAPFGQKGEIVRDIVITE